MQARKYQINILGQTPLLLHHDNISWAGIMKSWEEDPGNREKSTKGDDRSPAWRWIGSLYMENNMIVIPADNLMTVLREGGRRCPTGKGQATFKSQTQSGIVVDQSSWPIMVNGNTVSYEPIRELLNELDFSKHEETVKKLGFELFIKRAPISRGSKHVRVRPRFDNWELVGTMTVMDETITTKVLNNILTFAGAYSGLCDWRPSAPKSPGPFGKFLAEAKLL